MKLDKKSKDILQELVKGKGYFKTPIKYLGSYR